MDMNEKYGEMSGHNWIKFFAGLAIFFIGLFVMSEVGKDFHGFSGFLAPALLVGGLLVMVWGFIATRKKAE